MHAASPYFVNGDTTKGDKSTAFVIKHYAGDVTYKVSGFVQKNGDTVYTDQRKMVESSKDAVFKVRLADSERFVVVMCECALTGVASLQVLMANQATDDLKRADSAGTKFKKSLADLIEALSKCRPSYVRCIKVSTAQPQLWRLHDTDSGNRHSPTSARRR